MSDLPTGTVTLLAMDIEGSQRLIQELRDDYVGLLEQIRGLLRSEVERRDGQAVEVSGDTALFVFRRARDAARAAVAVKQALHEHPWPDGIAIVVNMGLHTGEPALSADGYVGVDVYRVMLLTDAASGGQIVASDATRQLIQDDLPAGVVLRDLGERRLGSLDRPERLSDLVVEGLPAAAPRPAAWSDLPGGTVTFLFTDIEGSTELTRRLGDAWPAVHAEHRRRLREAFTDSGGREVDTQGDSFFFVFARARHALAAAAAGQRALQEEGWPGEGPVPVRMGIHTGEPAIGEEGYLGLDVVRGARISALAGGGQILVSDATRALVRGDDLGGLELRDAGERELKGLEEKERVWELVVPGVERTFAAADDEEAFPIEGREAELASRALALVPDLGDLDQIGPRIERQVEEALRSAGVSQRPPPPRREWPRLGWPAFLVLLLVVLPLVWLLLDRL